MFILLAGVRVTLANTARVLLLASVFRPGRRGTSHNKHSSKHVSAAICRERYSEAYLESISIFELVELNISNTGESNLGIGPILQHHRRVSWETLYR